MGIAVGTLQTEANAFLGDRTSTTISITLAAPAVICVAVPHANFAGSPASSVSSSIDGSFGSAALEVSYGTSFNAALFLKSCSSGSHTLTVSLSGSAADLYGGCSAFEITGIGGVTIDKSSTNTASSDTPTTGSTGTQTAANSIAIVLLCGNGDHSLAGWTNPPSGFTNLRNAAGFSVGIPFSLDYKIKSSNAAENAGYGTLTTGDHWGAIILTLDEAAGANNAIAWVTA